MRKLSEAEKELWAKICATIDNSRRRSRTIFNNSTVQPSISSILDLHGHTEDTAYMAISQLLASNYQNGSREVTVITGKGKGGIGILRRLVPHWLDTSLSGYVRSYNFDPKNTGQLIVHLKKEKAR